MTRAVRMLLGAIAVAVLSTGTAAAQPIAIVGGKVYPVSGPPIENATVVINGERIEAVGVNVAVPANARRIDAKGKWVTPGFVHASATLGVVEVGAVADTNDTRAKPPHAVAAAFRVWDGLNPATVLWAPTRNEGVTSVVVMPSGGLVAGQAAWVDLGDGSRTDVVRQAPVAMVGQLGAPESAGASARGEVLGRLRELLEDAKTYAAKKSAYESGDVRAFSAGRLDLDAMGPVGEGRVPLVLDVDRASDIESALDLAADLEKAAGIHLRLVILGGAEAWKVAGRLAAAKVPVLTGALTNIPGSFASLGARQENAGLLRKAGVTVVVIGTQGDAFNVRNVRQDAGNAVAYGMTWDDALRAVTLAPAEVFGVESTVGSLQAGRDANVVVWDGDPFEFKTRAVNVFVRGRDVKGPSRQDELTERYKKQPPAYRKKPN
ncbi:MAG: amidohydrolase family protein [Vicinamibacterales bacterium]